MSADRQIAEQVTETAHPTGVRDQCRRVVAAELVDRVGDRESRAGDEVGRELGPTLPSSRPG